MGNTFLDQETFIVSFWGKIVKMILYLCVGMICNPSLRNTTNLMFLVGNINSVPGEDHLSSFSDESCPSPMTNQKQSSPPFF